MEHVEFKLSLHFHAMPVEMPIFWSVFSKMYFSLNVTSYIFLLINLHKVILLAHIVQAAYRNNSSHCISSFNSSADGPQWEIQSYGVDFLSFIYNQVLYHTMVTIF